MSIEYVSSQQRLDAMYAYNPFYVVREPFPAPQVSSRTQTAFTAPSAVLKLAEAAREAGWEVRTQYSEGCMPHTITGRPLALKRYIGMVFSGHPMTDRQAYAVAASPVERTAWTWDNTMIWGPKLVPYAGCSITDLKAFLIMPDASDHAIDEYVYTLKEIAGNAQKLKKERERIRRVVLAGHDAGIKLPGLANLAEGIYTQEQIKDIIDKRKTGSKEGFR